MTDPAPLDWSTDQIQTREHPIQHINELVVGLDPSADVPVGYVVGVKGRLGLAVVDTRQHNAIQLRALSIATPVVDLRHEYEGDQSIVDYVRFQEPTVEPDPLPDDPDNTYTTYGEHVFRGYVKAMFYGWQPGDILRVAGPMYNTGARLKP